jgi:acyl transferase domain-containing protein
VRVAAQSSFPDGGTNCHAVVEEFVPGGAYEQRYFPKPAPSLTRRRFPSRAERAEKRAPEPAPATQIFWGAVEVVS